MKKLHILLLMLSILPANLHVKANHNQDSDHIADHESHDFNSLTDVIANQKAEGNYEGSTPLHYLADGDGTNNATELKIALQVIKSNPEYINDQNNEFKHSPLHVAADTENFNFIQALVKAGANVNAQDVNGRTALHFIACGSEKNDDENSLKIAQFLIERGADISIKDNDGKSPADLAVEENAHPALKSLLATLKNLNM